MFEKCERCGCSDYDACFGEERGPCGWSAERPGWCTFCAVDPTRMILFFDDSEFAACRYDMPEEGKVASVVPLLFGQAKITVGPMDDRGFYDEDFMYETFDGAMVALESWTGDEPEGWVRHTPSNRRRPGGDPALEEVRA